MPTPELDGPIAAALAATVAWLEDVGTPYAVIGGVAVTLRALPRYTQDIDLVVWAATADWPGLVERAAAFGITPRRDDVLEFAARTRVLLLQHASGVPLDVSCGVLTFEEHVTRDASVVQVGNLRVRLATAEHLLVLKAIAARPQDHADMHAIVRASRDLDLASARATVVEFASALDAPELVHDFDRIVTRARAGDDIR